MTVHNLGLCIKRYSLDIARDETTYQFCGYGNEGVGWIRGKQHVTKGGQMYVWVMRYPRYIVGWHPRHKAYKCLALFTQEGPFEVFTMLNKLKDLVWDSGENISHNNIPL